MSDEQRLAELERDNEALTRVCASLGRKLEEAQAEIARLRAMQTPGFTSVPYTGALKDFKPVALTRRLGTFEADPFWEVTQQLQRQRESQRCPMCRALPNMVVSEAYEVTFEPSCRCKG